MKGLLRKILVVGIVALFLGAIGLVFFKVNMLAYGAGTIYIRANGLVEGTDKIVNENNVTYTLTDDINDSIVVERSNIIIDGDEYALNGSWSLMIGFNLTSVSNVTIKNVDIEGFLSYSIYLESASQCVISNNTVIGSEGGIGLLYSNGNTVSGNRISGCSEALDLFSASANVISGNNISDSSSGVHAFINCTGNTIYGNRMIANNQGVLLSSYSDFNTIIGNNITESINGVYLESSSGNSISGNDITNNSMQGIRLTSSNNNTLSENNITANDNGGIYLDESSNNVISGNNIRDSPNEHIALLHSSNNNTIFGNNLTNSTADVGIYAYGCSLNSFFGNNITSNANSGIRLDLSSHSTISENDVSENLNGVYLWYSFNITISGNDITANDADGIVLDNSNNNHLRGNSIIANNWWGINPAYSNNNTISGNNIRNNNCGINSASSDFNIVSANNITNNDCGIYLESSSNNTFHHNNLINNTNQAVVDEPGYANNWDNGIEGNYWSNYTGVDLSHDGIGDTSHAIDANNTDYYPLMGMFHSFNTSLGYYVNVISNSTIEGFTYFESNSTIIIHVSNMTADQTHGFCRISIPYEVVSEPFNVTIDGANPTYWNYTLYDNGTHRWIYFEYEHTTREIVIIPEFPALIIIPLFMIATLLIAIISRKKRTLSTRNKTQLPFFCLIEY